MSNNSGDSEKRENVGKFPINLQTTKMIGNIKTLDSKAIVQGGNPSTIRTINPNQMRVLTQSGTTVAVSSMTSGSTSSGPTSIIAQPMLVAQSLIKQDNSKVSLAGGINRPTQITLTSSSGATYHVPRGPAAVANMAAPRGSITTSIRGISAQPSRAIAPPRTPSPNVIQGSWHPTSIQVQQGTVNTSKTITPSSLVVSQPRAITTNVPLIQARTNVVARNQSFTPVSKSTTLLHASSTGQVCKMQTFKPVATVQSISSTGAPQPLGMKSVIYTTVTTTQQSNTTNRINIVPTNQRQIITNRTVSIPGNPTTNRTQHQGGTVFTSPGRFVPLVGRPMQTGTIAGATAQISKVIGQSPNTIQLAQVHPSGSNQQQNAKINVQQPQTQATVSLANQQATRHISNASISGQQLRFGQIIVDPHRSTLFQESTTTPAYLQSAVVEQSPPAKLTSSPRPSILRKRENDGAPLRAAKNLSSVLSQMTVSVSSAPTSSIITTQSGPISPMDSGENGHSSNGSTTISANSSPGPEDDRTSPGLMQNMITTANGCVQSDNQRTDSVSITALSNQDTNRGERMDVDDKPAEVSPRKKPRKQQLRGNGNQHHNAYDIQFFDPNKRDEDVNAVLKTDINDKTGNSQTPTPITQVTATPALPPTRINVKKPPTASLLHSYHQSWKSTQNHFTRYADVKPKDQQPPSIMEIANQKRILQKINGWKVYHLTSQMEDLSDLELQVYEKLSSILENLETKPLAGQTSEIEKISDLIKGNMQRSKLINDGMLEAKGAVLKIFEHKPNALDIVSRCASKRNFKKREKS